jgi:hypothetical protein
LGVLGDELFRAAVEDGDAEEDAGKWRVLRDMADGWEEMKRYIEPGPHVHALAAAEDVDGEAAPGGWVVKNIRSMGRFHIRDVDSYRPMARSAYYLLTHGAVAEDRQTVTYFGDVHPASFRPEEEMTRTEWERIKKNAALAVTTRPGDGAAAREEEPGPVGDECPRSECEAEVLELRFLDDYLQSEEWVKGLLAEREGHQRWLRLRGLRLWWFEGGDQPPPGTRKNEARLLEWLETQGRRHTASPRQASILGRHESAGWMGS